MDLTIPDSAVALNGTPTNPNVADAWFTRAPELADWALVTLVNRDDRHGQYYRTKDGQVRSCTSPAKAQDVKVGHLSRERLICHFRAECADHLVGVYVYGADKRGKWLAVDIDNHDGANDSAANRRYAVHLHTDLVGRGFTCLLYESNGNGGFHLWVPFATPVPADVLHRFANALVADSAAHGFTKAPEVFPKNAGTTPWGHWLRLPGRHHTRDVWSTVWTGSDWVTGADAVTHILSVTGVDPGLIPAEFRMPPEPIAKKEPKAKSARVGSTPVEDTPLWGNYNHRATLESVVTMLGDHGWVPEGERGDGTIPFVRPGKGSGQGANLKVVDGMPILQVFTDAADIPSGSHAPAAVRCHLEFRGDWGALSARLRAEGYGSTPAEPNGLTDSGYTTDPTGTYQCIFTVGPNGERQLKERKKLANFSAQIVGETVTDDGAEQTREFTVAIEQHGQPTVRIGVPVDQFAALDWVLERCGPKHVILAGSSKRDHLRCAIQELSGGKFPTVTVYTHTGWREIDERWCYLHGGGAVVAGSGATDVRLDGAAGGFRLLEPPTGDELRAAIRASLGLLDGLVPDGVAFPLLATVYRAALGTPDYALWLSGPTGAQKSELAALAQQHYGAEMNRTRLPGNWSSTDNALEGLAFTVKDALLVIDDFAPPSSRVDADRQHRAAERLIRGQGNSAGRQRMRADGTLRPPKPPRGLILATGEDVPRGHSITARLGVVAVQRGDVNLARLSNCQRDASTGVFASAMAGFVAWLPPQYSDVRDRLAAERVELRDRFVGQFAHARTPDVIANLLLGLRYLLRFAEEVGGIDGHEQEALERRGEAAFRSLAEEQCEHQRATDPVARFPEMLAAIISSGRGHIAGLDGREPEVDPSPEVWGWHGPAGARGRKIGWIGETELYLDPDSTFAALSELVREQGQAYPVTQQTLHRRLKEAGVLVRTEDTRTVATVTLERVRRRVLVLDPATLFRNWNNWDNRDTPS